MISDEICFSNKNEILIELINRQRKNVPFDKRLYCNDMKRISKFLTTSIFLNTCSCWTGYITNLKNYKKGTYINFYFRKKKKALHRLLYINFVDDLRDNEYIKFMCNNKGFCCSVNCMRKIPFNKKSLPIEDESVNTNPECSITICKPLFDVFFS